MSHAIRGLFAQVREVSQGWQVTYAVLAIWIAVTAIMKPDLFIAQFVSGFAFGIILVMIALGLALILGLMGVVNFAHGAVFMLGAYVAYSIVTQLGYSFWLALLIVPMVVGFIGIVLELVLLRPIYDEEPLTALLITFGLALMLDEAIHFIWGGAPQQIAVPAVLSEPVPLGFVTIPGFRLFTVAIGIVLITAVYLLVGRTDFGLTIKAGWQDAEMAEMAGINLPIRYTLTFGLGIALAGLAGLFRGASVGLDLGMGGSFLILAFVVVVVGGMGSLFGSIVSGLLIAWAQFLLPLMFQTLANVTALNFLYLEGIQQILPFIILIIVLLERPRGLYGREGFLE